LDCALTKEESFTAMVVPHKNRPPKSRANTQKQIILKKGKGGVEIERKKRNLLRRRTKTRSPVLPLQKTEEGTQKRGNRDEERRRNTKPRRNIIALRNHRGMEKPTPAKGTTKNQRLKTGIQKKGPEQRIGLQEAPHEGTAELVKSVEGDRPTSKMRASRGEKGKLRTKKGRADIRNPEETEQETTYSSTPNTSMSERQEEHTGRTSPRAPAEESDEYGRTRGKRRKTGEQPRAEGVQKSGQPKISKKTGKT